MTALYQGIIYVSLIFEVCTSSVFNLNQCVTDPHLWLYPSIQEGIELVTRQTIPYATEVTK